MADFFAAPFLLLANVSMWIAAFITGKGYLFAEVDPDMFEDMDDD